MKKKDDHGLKIFPSRTNKEVDVVESKTGESKIDLSGITPKAIIPDDTTAKGRTIRFHEGQHLNHSPRAGRKSLAELWLDTQMGIEDILIHTKYMPMDVPRSVLRDEKATALQDLRLVRWSLATAKQLKIKIPDKMWNVLMIMALRSKAILSRKEVDSVKERMFLPKALERKMDNVLRLTRFGFQQKAGKSFQKLLRHVPEGSGSSRAGLWGGPNITPGALGKKMSKEDSLEISFPMSPVGNIQLPDGDVESPGKGDQEKIGNRVMPVYELELDVQSQAISHSRGYRYQSSGSMPSPFKLARASFSPVSSLFKIKMRKTEMGASFLLDASGSMSITAASLALIMEDIPAATIGFYSGIGLTIYADGGKHSSSKELNKDGANEWDHQALMWLLKQKKPWFFITDEAFCGGNHGQAERAMSLLNRNRKDVTVYHSYASFVSALKSGEVTDKIRKRNESK